MKLPKTLYIYVENEGQGEDEYLAMETQIKNIDAKDKRLLVGEYELKQKVEVVTETEIVAEVG